MKVAIDVTKEFELARVKDEFIRAAAHELKTPLAVIIANAETAVEEAVLSSRSIEGLRRGIERADRLIHSLLDLVDVQGGLFSLARVPVRLDGLVGLVISRLPQSSAVRVHVSELSPVTILGDESRLRRAIQSVLDNAIKYSSKPTPIEIAVRAEGGSATLTIRDAGVGIPRDLQPRIFEKYFRAHAGTPRDPGGMGISLFVAREVVAQHGGRIWFESVENEGTVFFIELPIATLPRQ